MHTTPHQAYSDMTLRASDIIREIAVGNTNHKGTYFMHATDYVTLLVSYVELDVCNRNSYSLLLAAPITVMSLRSHSSSIAASISAWVTASCAREAYDLNLTCRQALVSNTADINILTHVSICHTVAMPFDSKREKNLKLTGPQVLHLQVIIFIAIWTDAI